MEANLLETREKYHERRYEIDMIEEGKLNNNNIQKKPCYRKVFFPFKDANILHN